MESDSKDFPLLDKPSSSGDSSSQRNRDEENWECGDMIESGFASNSCLYVQNIQAMAENNYIKRRAETASESSGFEGSELENNRTAHRGERQGVSATEKLCTGSQLQNLNEQKNYTNSALPDILPEANRTAGEEKMDVEGAEHQMNECDKALMHDARPKSSAMLGNRNTNNRNIVPVEGLYKSDFQEMELVSEKSKKTFDRPTKVQLQQSDYFSMLSLPVTIRDENCEQCNQEQLSRANLFTAGTSSVKVPEEKSSGSQCSDTVGEKRQPGECFKVDLTATKQNCINYLPSSILVHIFRNLSVHGLLQRASLVCKYWYNLCRDPDLWVNLSLVNQHRLKDSDFQKVTVIWCLKQIL